MALNTILKNYLKWGKDMKMKRSMIALVAIILIAGLLVGCSSTELGFFKLYREMSSLKTYEYNGEIFIDLEQIPEQMISDADSQKRATKLQEVLEQFSIIYKGRTDIEKNTFIYDFYLKDRRSGEERGLTSLLYKDGIIYVQVKEAVAFLKTFNDEEFNQELDRFLGDTEYISFDLREYQELYGMSMMDMPFDNTNLNNIHAQQNIYYNFFSGLMNEVYEDFETDMVTKNGGKYTLTLDAEKAVNLLYPLLIYTIENFEDFGTYLKTFADGLSTEEMALLGIEPYMLEEFNSFMDIVVVDVTANADQYLQKIKEELEPEIREELREFLEMTEGSKILTSIEKIGDGSYETSMVIDLKIKETEGSGENILNAALTVKNTIKPSAGFDIVVPVTGVVSFGDLVARFEVQSISIFVEENSFRLDTGAGSSIGEISVKMIDGSIYLPLRQVAETFEEQVGWNDKERQAYVLKGGQEIYLTGQNIEGITYIKIRDFEKLGYKIDWNQETKTVLITK